MSPLLAMIERGLTGQLAAPPNTAISTPQQQAISLMQGGPNALANAFGIGGQGLGQTQGLQSRAQLGIPDRSTYFPFMPTTQQVESLGLLPPLTQQPARKKAEDRLGKLEKQRQTPARQKQEQQIEAQNPEGPQGLPPAYTAPPKKKGKA